MVDDELWSSFLAYIATAPAVQHPGVLFEGFGRSLVERGVDADEAQRLVRTIREQARTRDDWAAPMFDRIYTSDAPLFTAAPNAFVAGLAAARAPGRALDVAMGQGRNAVHLARNGGEVTGFDVSPAGVRAAQEAEAAAGTSLDAVLASSEDFDYGHAAWDLIILTYALVPVVAPDFASRIAEALAPGAMVAVETFVRVDDRPPRPVDVDPDELRVAYGSLVERAFEVVDTVADWTLETARVVRFAGERVST